MADLLNFSSSKTSDLAVAVNPTNFTVGAQNTTIVAPKARCVNGMDRYTVSGQLVQSQNQSQVILDFTGNNSLLVVFDVRKQDGSAIAALTAARKTEILQGILSAICNAVGGLG